MGQTQKQIFIEAPLQRVWAIWKDVSKTPEWVEGVQQSKVTSQAIEGVGLTWEEGCLFGNLPVHMEHQIKEWYEADKTVVHTALPMGGILKRVTKFKCLDACCEIMAELDWDLGMAAAFVGEEKAEFMMVESLEKTLQNLKKRAES